MARNNTRRYAAVAAVALGLATFAGTASAQLTATDTGDVTVTVDNTISITQTTPMDFGTTAAIGENGQTGTLAIDVSGTMTPTAAGNAQFIPDGVSTPSQGIFDVEGPNGATITVTLPAAPVAVDCATGPDFTLGTFVDDTGGGTVSTSGTGTPVTVNVGATLSTDNAVVGTVAYDNGACTGTYTMTVGF